MKRWQRRVRIETIYATARKTMAKKSEPEFSAKSLLRELDDLRVNGGTQSHEWLEARIMLQVINRSGIKRVRRNIANYRSRCIAEGSFERFQALQGRINDYLHPHVITNHGYAIPFAHADHDEIWAHVDGLIEGIESLGYEAFLNSGTLLGVVREGGFLPHDDDVDLAVMLKSQGLTACSLEWQALFFKLYRAGLLSDEQSDNPLIYKLVTKSGIMVDLFPMWIEKGRVFIYPHTYGELSRCDVLPFRRCAVSGQKLPAQPEKMLAVNYGENWHAPDPTHRFDWAGQNEKFQHVIETVEAKAG